MQANALRRAHRDYIEGRISLMEYTDAFARRAAHLYEHGATIDEAILQSNTEIHGGGTGGPGDEG